jgi:hypothetical protein
MRRRRLSAHCVVWRIRKGDNPFNPFTLFSRQFMFSNDKNIETIGQLVETLKHYATLQGEYMRLDVVEKTVRLLTAITMTLIVSLLIVLMLIYLSFAAAIALATWVGEPMGFLIVAGAYFVLLLLFLAFRKQWIVKPLVKFLASILLSK